VEWSSEPPGEDGRGALCPDGANQCQSARTERTNVRAPGRSEPEIQHQKHSEAGLPRGETGFAVCPTGYRYCPVFAIVSMERPASVPLVPVTSVRM
jgi:hypothetical protein